MVLLASLDNLPKQARHPTFVILLYIQFFKASLMHHFFPSFNMILRGGEMNLAKEADPEALLGLAGRRSLNPAASFPSCPRCVLPLHAALSALFTPSQYPSQGK